MDVVSAYYARYLDAADIEYVTDIDAGHGLATNDGTVSCGATRAPYLNDCGYDTAGALLNHLHGGDLTRPGFVYVPHACRQGAACRLHVALHGCRQSAQSLGDDFAMLSGYNSWAEANRIVVLYPQARPTASWWPGRSNPRGCWDWWGYTSDRYYGRRAPQIEAIASMVRHIIGEIQ